MTMSNYPGFATVQVRTELSLGELMALYWDALVEDLSDAEAAERYVEYNYNTGAKVRDLVRRWLTWYGERSVECGPRNDYPTAERFDFEARLKVIVAKAYKIVY
jgi:hypothetical protein